MLGQTLDITNNPASGYYLASNEAVEAMNAEGTNLCPQGMRPGRMVIKGLPNGGFIPTCNGQISQQDLPDIHIINWPYRIYVDGVLVACIVALLVAISLKMIR